MRMARGRASITGTSIILFKGVGRGKIRTVKTAEKKLGLGDPWGNKISECFLLSRVIFSREKYISKHIYFLFE